MLRDWGCGSHGPQQREAPSRYWYAKSYGVVRAWMLDGVMHTPHLERPRAPGSAAGHRTWWALDRQAAVELAQLQVYHVRKAWGQKLRPTSKPASGVARGHAPIRPTSYTITAGGCQQRMSAGPPLNVQQASR